MISKDNQQMLNEVLEGRLARSQSNHCTYEEQSNALQDAIDVTKVMAEYEEVRVDKKRARLDTALKILTLVATVAVVPIIDMRCKKSYAKTICEFEQTDTFTTTAGKGLGGYLRLK